MASFAKSPAERPASPPASAREGAGFYALDLRRPITKKRDQCADEDAYTRKPWREHGLGNVHVDHVVEVQLVQTVLKKLPHGRALAQSEPLIDLVNAPINLNVTEKTVNMQKGAVFRPVVRDVLLGKPVQTFEDYVLQTGARVTRLQKREARATLGEAVCTIWQDRVHGPLERDVDEALAERIDEVMKSLFP